MENNENIILPDDEYTKQFENIDTEELRRRDRASMSRELNQKRNRELSSLMVDNISCTESNLFKMAVKFSIMQDSDKVIWIDIDNNPVEMTKQELGILINKGSTAAEAIYFRYRKLKDEL
jgi:hypothetical protein